MPASFLERALRTAAVATVLVGAAACSRPWATLQAEFDASLDAGDSGFVTDVPGDDGAGDAPPGFDVPRPLDTGADVGLDVVSMDAADVLDAVDVADAVDESDVTPACPPGQVSGRGGLEGCIDVAVPRLIAPITSAVLATNTPTLTVSVDVRRGQGLPPEVELEFDQSPSFQSPARFTTRATVTAVGLLDVRAQVRVGPGYWYWRAYGWANNGAGSKSVTWSFAVPSNNLAGVDSFTGYSLADLGPGAVGDDRHSDVVVTFAQQGLTDPFAHVYFGNATGVDTSMPVTLNATLAEAGTTFGATTAILGTFPNPPMGARGPDSVALVAAPGFSKVFAYRMTGVLPGGMLSPTVTLSEGVANFGTSIAVLNDVDSGGAPDFVVGATSGDLAYLFLGESLFTVAGPASTIQCPAPCAIPEFGDIVAPAGDVDGDGHVDLAVSAKGASSVLIYRYVMGQYTAPWEIDIPSTDGVVRAVAGVGDLDNDGYGDVIVGVGTADPTTSYGWVFRGTALGPEAAPTLRIPMGGLVAVQPAGDLDGDRRPDFVFGNYGGGLRGVQIFRAARANPIYASDQFTPPDMGSTSGQQLALAGDVNADGRSDLIVGNGPLNDVKLYLGLPGPPPQEVTLPAPAGSSGFGTAVAVRSTPRRGPHAVRRLPRGVHALRARAVRG